jgi:hypothetical protein
MPRVVEHSACIHHRNEDTDMATALQLEAWLKHTQAKIETRETELAQLNARQREFTARLAAMRKVVKKEPIAHAKAGAAAKVEEEASTQA